MNMPIIKTYDKQIINPSNLILHDREGKLGFVNESDRNSIYMFDLEKGQITEELRGPTEGIIFDQIANESKNGQSDVDRTILGMNAKAIY